MLILPCKTKVITNLYPMKKFNSVLYRPLKPTAFQVVGLVFVLSELHGAVTGIAASI